MKQPKVYIKHLNKVLEVESIRFDTKVVEVYNEDRSMYSYYDFEDIEFIYNTGYKDMDGNYIYTGDILEYKDTGERYLRKYVVEKDEDTEYYYYLTIEERYFVDRVHGMEGEYLVIGNIYENKELLED